VSVGERLVESGMACSIFIERDMGEVLFGSKLRITAEKRERKERREEGE